MSKRGYQDWLDSLPGDHDDYPHQDDLTEEELRALAEKWPESLPLNDADPDAMAWRFSSDDALSL
ncbi:MAG TPA: hypothetical protein VLM40_07400 [Gemmata sp.]|nr:hypothetical protein [Gemmata sp.]